LEILSEAEAKLYGLWSQRRIRIRRTPCLRENHTLESRCANLVSLCSGVLVGDHLLSRDFEPYCVLQPLPS
jgi:hypothetical protein